MTISNKNLAFLLLLSVNQTVSAQTSCNATALNTTIGSWPVTSTDTIFSIAASTARGVCDIARANRMSDATLMQAGESLIIPAETCEQDDTTCLIANATHTAACISGGLHTYNTRLNDTRNTIALKFMVTLDAISAATSANGTLAADEILPTDQQLKIPQCSPSQCIVQPYKFTYGTYVDLAKQFNTTVGQIMAFNPTFNYSHEADPTEGPVISMPMNCTNLSANITVIS